MVSTATEKDSHGAASDAAHVIQLKEREIPKDLGEIRFRSAPRNHRMNILGINHYFHDSSACIVQDGKLIAAIEEERLNRDKHTTEFPELAIDRCLEIAGIGIGDVDHVAFSAKPTHNWTRKLAYAAANPSHAAEFLKHEMDRITGRQRRLARWFLESIPLTGRRPKLHFIEHHLSHVAGTFLLSPYDEAALLGMDGSGEWATSFLGHGCGNRVTRYHENYFPMSLGSFYEAVTEFLGFRPNYDEGKTMGLAPYGDPDRFYKTVSDIVRMDESGVVKIDLSYFEYQFHGWTRCGNKFHATFGKPRQPKEDFAAYHRDVAAAFQRVLEDRALQLCRILKRKTGARHLVVAGGVALNSVMNGRIIRESDFDDLYVMPGAGDSGTSIGAAYYVYNALLDNPRTGWHSDPYVGTEYDNGQIKDAIDAVGTEATYCEHPEQEAATLLHQGKIIAWFQGKMEFGPRSLGNRSILANPTIRDMKAVLNERVKHREEFRPFAPSCIIEAVRDYFDLAVEDPFMLKVCPVRPNQREALPAITHVDGSARLQTVRSEINPIYHRLIEEFGRLTSIPVVLNTSFNVMGQPIVEAPRDAVECYLGTGIDALFIGNYLLEK